MPAAPPSQPPAGRCAYYVSAKRRFCSWPLLPGLGFCGHHAPDRRVRIMLRAAVGDEKG
jgi:hypothetical protein